MLSLGVTMANPFHPPSPQSPPYQFYATPHIPYTSTDDFVHKVEGQLARMIHSIEKIQKILAGPPIPVKKNTDEESSHSKETSSNMSKLLLAIPAHQVFDENSKRVTVQYAPVLIPQGNTKKLSKLHTIFKYYTSKTYLLDDFMYYENRKKLPQQEKTRQLINNYENPFIFPPRKLDGVLNLPINQDAKLEKNIDENNLEKIFSGQLERRSKLNLCNGDKKLVPSILVQYEQQTTGFDGFK